MIFCNPVPIAHASYLAKNVVADAHRAIFKAKSGVILNELVEILCFWSVLRSPGVLWGPAGSGPSIRFPSLNDSG